MPKTKKTQPPEDGRRRCRVCGCTDERGCAPRVTGGKSCHWVADDLCSFCSLQTNRLGKRTGHHHQSRRALSCDGRTYELPDERQMAEIRETLLRTIEDVICAGIQLDNTDVGESRRNLIQAGNKCDSLEDELLGYMVADVTLNQKGKG